MNIKERILLRTSILWIFADGLLGPLFAVYVQKIGGGDISEITWAWALYLVSTGLFSILVGWISDYYSKERLMIAGYFLTAFFTFSYLLVETPVHLYVVQIGLGFALALCNSTWSSLYAKYAPKKHDGYVWGLADGESKIVTGFAILLGGYIVSSTSFETLFILMGTIHLCASLYLLTILKK